jgi:hypothetical protein
LTTCVCGLLARGNGQKEQAAGNKQKGILDELKNDIVLSDLHFKVQEELYDIKGNEMDAVFVQSDMRVKGSSVTEWACVFMEGVHVCEQNVKHLDHVGHYGEVDGEDDGSSIDSQL